MPKARNAVEFAKQKLGFTPDARQAQLLCSNEKRVLVNCSRQWGKSTIAAIKAVHQAWTEPGSLTLVISPSGRQSAEFVRKARQFVARLGFPPRGDGDNDISIAFPTGSRIVGLPGVESTARGFSSVSLLIVDEAAWITEKQYTAVGPMLAVSDGTLWMISTPAGQRGVFYREWTRGGDQWMRVTAPATACRRISPSFLERERARMDDESFRSEYLCEFVDGAETLFRREMIDEAIDESVLQLVL